MGYWTIGSLLTGFFDSVFRPSKFVAAEATVYDTRRIRTPRQVIRILGIYLLNLLTYAIPLTLTGIGVPEPGQMPLAIQAAVPLSGHLLRFTYGLLQNSAYITVAAGITFLTYHLAAVFTLNSSGILQSLHTVVYSTSAYLAGLFTVVWYVDMKAGLSSAATFLRNVQLLIIYTIIDGLGVPFELANHPRPETVSAGTLTQTGVSLLAIALLLIGYYVYSLYLGARINHEMSRISSLIAVLFVSVSPVVYVAGTVLVVALTG